jgi:formiminotetrahydrofolate cyclodeaminase
VSVVTAVRLTGGGPTAARTIGLAAEIVATVARASHDSWADAPGVAAQAVELAERCPELADEDERAWHAALDGLDRAVEEANGDRDDELRQLLADSVELPVRIAEVGADVTELAAAAARLGDGRFRADAVSAALLAHAGVRVARHLVEINLGTKDGDVRSTRVSSAEWRADQAVGRALAAADAF